MITGTKVRWPIPKLPPCPTCEGDELGVVEYMYGRVIRTDVFFTYVLRDKDGMMESFDMREGKLEEVRDENN